MPTITESMQDSSYHTVVLWDSWFAFMYHKMMSLHLYIMILYSPFSLFLWLRRYFFLLSKESKIFWIICPHLLFSCCKMYDVFVYIWIWKKISDEQVLLYLNNIQRYSCCKCVSTLCKESLITRNMLNFKVLF